MMDLTGQADGPPTRSGVAIGDFLAGYNGAFGVMLALWERNASGLGQMVDVGLFDSTVLPVIAQAMVSEVRHTGRARRRIGNGSWYSFVDSFEALDGTVMICPAIESQWRRLARTIGRADLLDDERYRDNLSRFEHRDEISPNRAGVGGTAHRRGSLRRHGRRPASPARESSPCPKWPSTRRSTPVRCSSRWAARGKTR